MIIIPARLKSSRFHEKILCDVGGVPMFVATARRVSSVDEVCIALDDEKVLSIAKEYGLNAVLTNKDHESGTDRINEACKKLALKDDEIIINVQADEPFIECENLLKFKEFTSSCLDKKAFMASCYKKITQEEAMDPNLVKVLCDKEGMPCIFQELKSLMKEKIMRKVLKGI